jgi:hypothetical protein
LFGFFSSAFAAFEASFYGLFMIGAALDRGRFPMATARDQQAISPARTNAAFTAAFPGDPILAAFTTLFGDAAYLELREVRNILTHRTAPGRRFYVGLGDDDAPAGEWKTFNIVMDKDTTETRRATLAKLLTHLLTASEAFVVTKL